MTDLEILESLPSLYPLKDYEEEAVLNVCKMFEDIKAEIEKERIKAINYPNWEYSKGLAKSIEIIDKHIGKE